MLSDNTGSEQNMQTNENIESEADIKGRKVTENVYLCPDGKYRWIYEYRMRNNPAILITVMKVILISFAIVMAIMVLIFLIGGDFHYWERSDYFRFFGIFLIVLLVILAIGVLSYLLVAAIYGGSYQVLFTMDENGVEQRQMKKDYRKTQAIGWLSAAAGFATGNAGLAGAGIVTATRYSMLSEFRRVRKVRSVRSRNVIYVNHLIDHNQIYAENTDFDFVEKYILDRCTKAKVK